jgi:hypothetical protein
LDISPEGEEFVNRDFQFLREMQRDLGIRKISPTLDRIDRLALTLTRRARSEAPMPRLFRISATWFFDGCVHCAVIPQKYC